VTTALLTPETIEVLLKLGVSPFIAFIITAIIVKTKYGTYMGISIGLAVAAIVAILRL